MATILVAWMFGVGVGFVLFPLLGEMYRDYHREQHRSR